MPETEGGLRRAIGESHRRYTRRVNFRECWRGHLWQGRFASYPMDDAHLWMAARYVERNPVRAGLARCAWQYRWSSARAHVEGRDDALVRVKPLLDLVGDWREYLHGEESPEEAERLRMHERTGRPLGSERFVKRLEQRLGRRLGPQKRGPKPKAKRS